MNKEDIDMYCFALTMKRILYQAIFKHIFEYDNPDLMSHIIIKAPINIMEETGYNFTCNTYSEWVHDMYISPCAIPCIFIGTKPQNCIMSILTYLELVKSIKLYEYLIAIKPYFLFIIFKYVHYANMVCPNLYPGIQLFSWLILKRILKCNANIISNRLNQTINYTFFKYYFNYNEQKQLISYVKRQLNITNCLFKLILGNISLVHTKTRKMLLDSVTCVSVWPFVAFIYLNIDNDTVATCFKKLLQENNVTILNWQKYSSRIKAIQMVLKSYINKYCKLLIKIHRITLAIPDMKRLNRTNHCWNCSKQEYRKILRLCSQCKVAYYCNKKCQKIHWKRHKCLCIKIHHQNS